MPKPHVSLRVHVPLQLFERIGEYRHSARHDSKNEALVTLIAAGLAALAKPVELPPAAVSASNGKVADPDPAPRTRSKLVAFAGATDNPRGGGGTRNGADRPGP